MHRWLLALLVLSSAFTVHAADGIPATLEPWRQWVLHDQEFRACSLIAGRGAKSESDFLCAWPGTLTIDATSSGAEFQQRWQVEAESWVPLPGDSEHWPQQIRVNGQPMAVVDVGGPRLRLVAGSYEIRALMRWSQRPQSLRVSEQIGLVTLRVDGQAMLPVQRDGENLKLGRGAVAVSENDSVDLRVHRKLVDGVPMQLITQLTLHASGQAREVILGPALPEGFAPLSLDSGSWPARLDGEGRLHVQVQPGTDTLILKARALSALHEIAARVPEAWAKQEIWSYEAQPRLRVTQIVGEHAIDPGQADVPLPWRQLPAFALDDGEQLRIEERSRGAATDDGNRLTLQREAWLDFSGNGWYARDHLSGRMKTDWRLDAAAPYVLQRAAFINTDGVEESMLITRSGHEGVSGVEWRTPALDLRAGLRIDADSMRLSVTGWEQVFDDVTTTLHLPHGYRLIAAPGTDSASGSWISAWTLLDIFIVAIIALVAARVLGRSAGVVAAVFLLLSYQEWGAPLWSLLLVMVLIMSLRFLPSGRLAQAAQWGRLAALALVILVAAPFAAQQLRQAIYPQLESSHAYRSTAAVEFPAPVEESYEMMASDESAARATPMAVAAPPPAPPAPPPPMASGSKVMGKSGSLDSIAVSGSRIRPSPAPRYVDNRVIQTGAGEPRWDMGNNYTLSWSGPVLPTQQVRLLIVEPWLLRALRVLLVLLLGVLVWRMARGSTLPWRAGAMTPSVRTGSASASALVLLLFAGLPAPVQAQMTPDPSVLQEMKTRLTQPPVCAPHCVNLARAELIAHGDQLRVALEVHALEAMALPIPFDERGLELRAVLLDGVAKDGVQGYADSRWVRVPRGVHRLELVFGLLADSVNLAFPLTPEWIDFRGEGWLASGLVDQHLLAETVRIVRERDSSSAPVDSEMQQFAPYVRVVRTLSLEQEWKLDNRVERLAPVVGGFSVELPLLANEHVSSVGVRARDGAVTAVLGEHQDVFQWSSMLEQGERVSFTAPELAARAEVWRIVVGPTWHIDFEGVPEAGVQANSALTDYRVFEFHPLPGETLAVTVSRPAPAAGASLAIDHAALTSRYAQRSTNHELDLDLRASQGGEHALRLPAGSQLLGVSRNGASINLRDKDGQLSLPLTPGKQEYRISWREDVGASWSTRTPAIDLGLAATNIDVVVALPEDRWLLAARGPAVGPAFLFWGELLVMIGVAWLLSRWPYGRLRFHHWLLLTLGFSTFSWWPLLVVVAWLFALQWRERNRSLVNPVLFNLAQVGLVLLTLTALVNLLSGIRNGLLGSPDMLISGNQSTSMELRWFTDQISGVLPQVTVWSLPMWVFRSLMLVWALWLAWALLGWLQQGFMAWMSGGYWRVVKPAVAKIDVPDLPPPLP